MDAAPEPEPTPEPREPAEVEEPRRAVGSARTAFSFLGRLALAGVAAAVGGFGSQKIRIGTALAADRYIAGSVAILACAAGMIGLVLLLVGSSPRRSQSISLGSRLLGFVLASCGIFVAVALVLQGGEEEFPPAMPDEAFDAMPMPPDPYLGEPFTDPETGEPVRPFPGPPGPGGEGFEGPVMPEAIPDDGPEGPGPPP